MNFGLGLVLSFTDRASSGINSAVNSLNNLTSVAEGASNSLNSLADTASLSALSVIADRVGSAFETMGSKILTSFGGIISKINDTGQTVMFATQSIGKLYSEMADGSDIIEKGSAKMKQIQDYAKQSIFNFEDLIPVVRMLKANGIEAFDEITSSTGNTQAKLMDLAADLAAFNPQMRNAYGTGIQAAMGALNEYIAEGNKKSLKSGASLDITAILGEDKGKTIEERSRQVADLMEKLNMVGMVSNLAGTPMQMLSNMGDVLFTTLTKIANSGVYDAMSKLISKIAEFVFALDESGRLDKLATVLADAIVAILEPLEPLIDKLVEFADKLVTVLSNNPALAKMAIIGTALGGVLLVLAGIVLKATSAFSGMAIVMKTMGVQFSSISKVVAMGAKKILLTLLPLIAVAGLLYAGWKSDFGGIRSTTTDFVNNVADSWTTAKDAVSGNVEDMIAVLDKLDPKNDFFDGLTLGFMRVRVFLKALAEGWNGFTLSEDTFLKAKELGILPLIEALFQLKYRFDFFAKGFSDGWKKISDIVVGVLNTISVQLQGTVFEELLNKVTSFFQMISGGNTDAWYQFGKTFGEFTAKALIFTVALGGIFSVIKKVIGVVSVVGKLGGVLKGLFSLIMANPVVAIIVGIVALLTVLYTQCEEFRNFVNSMFTEIYNIALSVLEPLKQMFIETMAQFMPVLQNLIASVMAFLPQILPFIQQIGQFIAQVASKLIEVAINILPSLMRFVEVIVNTIAKVIPLVLDVLDTIFGVVSDLLLPVIMELIDVLVPFFETFISQYAVYFENMVGIVVALLEDIVPIITNLIDMIVPMLRDIFSNLMPIIDAILGVVTTITGKLFPIIEKIASVVSTIIKVIVALLAPVVTIIVQIVQLLVSVLSPVLETIINIIGFLIDVILGCVDVIVSGIDMAVSALSAVISVVLGIVNTLVQVVMVTLGTLVGFFNSCLIEPICALFNSIVAVAQAVWDGIVSVFSGAFGFFSGVFQKVYEAVTGVFQNIAKVFSDIWTGLVTAFNTIGDTISGAIKGAINTVLGGAVKIVNGFIRAINTAIGVINAIPGVSISKLTELSVPAMATGGVVDSPTTALIGEAGKEAVIPLENNTGWMLGLADALAPAIAENMTPTSSIVNASSNTNTGNEYMTSNNNSVVNEGSTDNSVNFSSGAIVIQCQNASDAEAESMARKIMEYIQRQKELNAMTSYA